MKYIVIEVECVKEIFSLHLECRHRSEFCAFSAYSPIFSPPSRRFGLTIPSHYPKLHKVSAVKLPSQGYVIN